MDSIPDSVLEYGLPFDWEEIDVWKLDVPVTKIPIEELIWHFEVPFWDYEDNFYAITPNDVINNPSKYYEHYNRIINSDISYPIDVIENKGRLVILDGLHRLVNLYIKGYKKIDVRIVPQNMIPLFAKEETSS